MIGKRVSEIRKALDEELMPRGLKLQGVVFNEDDNGNVFVCVDLAGIGRLRVAEYEADDPKPYLSQSWREEVKLLADAVVFRCFS